MKIEIARHERMSESGSSLLRLIQNQNVPLLDLLVRESVQNSLDASTDVATSVDVDFKIGKFVCKDLNKHFEKIDAKLNKRFTASTNSFISIRDVNTVGLTGPVKYSEVKNNNFGNLIKLVYEICKPQTNEGAGGSWGLGKTIYFRVGIGLVIYYSRIRLQNGRYESRMAACLVEDETKPNRLIPEPTGVKRGIAWWGKYADLGHTATVPEDKEREIAKVLSVFDIPAYQGNETGTTVIIPYISESRLLNEVYAKNESSTDRPYWTGSISDYINVAIQKWYAPRLMNRNYKYGAFLRASVNSKAVTVNNMLSTFKAIRELYLLANDNTLDLDSLIRSGGVEYGVENIDIRGVLNSTTAGKLAYAKFTRKQLLMDPPDNQKTPYQQIDNINVPMEGGNGPIMMFTRKPGMIVGYDYDGQWTHRMPRSNPDEFIIGIFVANSNNTLKNISDVITGKPITLEEYIRQGEKADHALWMDRNIGGQNPKIIYSIQKNVINKIKKKYSEQTVTDVHRQNIGLGHALADLLLPSENFGRGATIPPEKKPNPSKGTRKSSLKMTGACEYLPGGEVRSAFEINLTGKPCELALQVLTDFKKYSADSWESEDEIGTAFPVRIASIKLDQIVIKHKTGKKQHFRIDEELGEKLAKVETDMLKAELYKSEIYQTLSMLKLDPKGNKYSIKGSVVLEFTDPGIKGSLDIKEIG